ncbi:unnamed protein product [Alternaria alternata]
MDRTKAPLRPLLPRDEGDPNVSDDDTVLSASHSPRSSTPSAKPKNLSKSSAVKETRFAAFFASVAVFFVAVPRYFTTGYKRCGHAFAGMARRRWTSEALSILFASLSLLGLVATLVAHQGKSLPQWPQLITINSIVSLFSILIRAGVGVVLAEANPNGSGIGSRASSKTWSDSIDVWDVEAGPITAMNSTEVGNYILALPLGENDVPLSFVLRPWPGILRTGVPSNLYKDLTVEMIMRPNLTEEVFEEYTAVSFSLHPAVNTYSARIWNGVLTEELVRSIPFRPHLVSQDILRFNDVLKIGTASTIRDGSQIMCEPRESPAPGYGPIAQGNIVTTADQIVVCGTSLKTACGNTNWNL